MYDCNECGKQFEKPLVKEDLGELGEEIEMCPHCNSEWIMELEIPWPVWVGPEGATNKELYGKDND